MDQELEALIDRAGRQQVFDLMRASGWGPYDRPPKFAWQEACRLLLSVQPSKRGQTT